MRLTSENGLELRSKEWGRITEDSRGLEGHCKLPRRYNRITSRREVPRQLTRDEEPCVTPLLRGCGGVLLNPNQINRALRVSQSYVSGEIMNRLSRLAVALFCVLWAVQGGMAQAQWGFPWRFGGFCWGGWGAATAEGDLARGMGPTRKAWVFTTSSQPLPVRSTHQVSMVVA